jgi:hypothetical protein
MYLQHHVFKLILDFVNTLLPVPLQREPNQFFPAPAVHSNRILDFKTGTDIWANEIADKYPIAYVEGVDITQIQPRFVSLDCWFYLLLSLEEVWRHGRREKFEFIHLKNMGGNIMDWARLHRRIYEHLKPRGWCEIQE